ncbi:uncharacterized protein LOC114516249 [Dendronephthya gigantea]|uniref:uncharacterized protein LOC114516249 n=1 Tax=Dendronephthya gigantea TaxID=151771 RepID=UPI001069F1E2|nr:uncharacterized protein LOC114516249 [Dendronephthya gigantea]XP_028391474.1 uncharacterized protein LOC114516249 [Dendronephthya gigantea]
MSSSQEENGHNDDWTDTTLQELDNEERSPVEESFYESYIIQSRTAVDNLYASNVLSCQKHVKEVSDLARQRKVKLSALEREQKKLLKRMENLKEKQETQRRSNERSSSPKVELTGTSDKVNFTDRRRGSLPPLTAGSKDSTSKMVTSSDRLSVTSNILSKSCNDVSSLEAPSQGPTLVLPAIKPSRSYENLSGSPFVTHISSKVRKYPRTSRGLASREKIHLFGEPCDAKTNWDDKHFKDKISTKVKWVPRN